MNCSRTDPRRQIDFSAVRNPDSLMNAIKGLLSRRQNPMSENDIVKWFRATPRAFVETQLVIAAGRGMFKAVTMTRGGIKYYIDRETA